MIDYHELNKILTQKKIKDWLIEYTEILNEALSLPDHLFDTGCFEEDCKEFWYLMRHAEFLWNDAVQLLHQDSYASSIFFSIITMEEIGKLSVARFQILMNNIQSRINQSSNTSKKRGPLYSHSKKHQLAAFAGFADNSRADRVLGVHNIVALLDLAKNGTLEAIRQNCIYSRPEQGKIVLPLTSRKKDDATFFCTAAGELLAEIGGFEPPECERLLERVVKFEKEFPLSGYELRMTA